jgi:hypothetical protein
MISNFVAETKVPPEAAPTSAGELSRFSAGFRFAPTDVYIALQNGHEFWINKGVVQAYSGRSVKPRANVSSGHNSLGSNELASVAATLLTALTHGKSVLSNVQPRTSVVTRRGAEYYEFLWPSTNSFHYGAIIELDSSSVPVYIELQEEGFFDYAFAAEISNRVYSADPRPLPKEVPRPKPTKDEVKAALVSWSNLLARIYIDTRGRGLEQVSWDKSFKYGTSNEMWKVVFKDGSQFQTCNGCVDSFAEENACYTGFWGDQPRAYWDKFLGIPTRRWEEMADDLKTVFVERLGIPDKLIRPLVPDALTYEGPVGSRGLRRILVEWKPRDRERVPAFIMAEFDVEADELKLLTFHDPELREALRRSLTSKQIR